LKHGAESSKFTIDFIHMKPCSETKHSLTKPQFTISNQSDNRCNHHAQRDHSPLSLQFSPPRISILLPTQSHLEPQQPHPQPVPSQTPFSSLLYASEYRNQPSLILILPWGRPEGRVSSKDRIRVESSGSGKSFNATRRVPPRGLGVYPYWITKDTL